MTDSYINNDREIKELLWELAAFDRGFYTMVEKLQEFTGENFYPILEAIWAEEQGL